MKRGKRFWGGVRRAFRWTRISGWLVLLLFIFALLYLNEVGLPGFVKRRVVKALEAEGLNVQFERLRLKGYRHILIEQVQLASTNAGAPVDFLAGRAELKFNRRELKRLRLKLDAVELDDAELRMDLSGSNGPPRSLSVTNIQTRIFLAARDRWIVPNFEGEALGARWRFSGTLTNLLAMAEKPPATAKEPQAVEWQGVLRDVLATVEKIHFSSPPSISVTALGDTMDLASFRASLSLRGDSAKSPWGDAQELFLRSSVGPSTRPGEEMVANVNIKLKSAITRFGELKDATLVSETVYPLTNSAAFESLWTFRAGALASDWFSGRAIDLSLKTAAHGTNLLTTVEAVAENPRTVVGAATRADFQARLEHAYPIAALNSFLADLLPVKSTVPFAPSSEILSLGQHWTGDWRLKMANLRTKYATAREIAVNGDVRERKSPSDTDASWGFWRALAPWEIHWNAEAVDFAGPDARIEKIAASGIWSAPEFRIQQMDSTLYEGAFHLEASLDVASRMVTGKTDFDFDVKKTASLLDPEVRAFLNQFTWEKPPKIDAQISFVAPSWTNRFGTNAWQELLRSARLQGSLAVGPSAYRGVGCSELATHFYLTNLQWHLPDLVVKRPEGQLELDYTGHAYQPPFRLAIRGGVHPWAALPLLSKDAQSGLKMVQFKEAPRVDGVLSGLVNDLDSLHFEGSISVSNIVVNKEPFLDGRVRVVYTNQWIYCFEPIAHRTTNEVLMAPSAAIDLKRLVMHVTNGFSTTDPYRFTKMLGPEIYRAIEPYQFKAPPTVRINGIVPLMNEKDADIRFQIDGDEFSYWRFNMSKARAGVHWHHEFLEVTNVTGKFYGGDVEWEGHFEFKPDDSADYRFKCVVTNVNVTPLLVDLLPGMSNRIEGTLQGTLVVTEANSDELKTWRGHGMATLKNGFLWDIPVFGVFSPALESIAPGFGRSKISSGAGTFKIEKGRIHTKDMEVRAPAFRLQYDGSVDFDGNLDATVEAQLFRDTWIFGRAVSAAFWPLAKVFESKVSGNLSAPKSELAHIPKVMLFPLRPIQTIKELLPKDKDKEKNPPAALEPK